MTEEREKKSESPVLERARDLLNRVESLGSSQRPSGYSLAHPFEGAVTTTPCKPRAAFVVPEMDERFRF